MSSHQALLLRVREPLTRSWNAVASALRRARDRRRQHDHERTWRRRGVLVFAGVVCVATIALLSAGYVATREWRRGVEQLVIHRNAEAIALASSVVARDMRGAWTSLIVPINELTIAEEPPYNLLQPVSRAFARFSYPETFFVWKAGSESSRRPIMYAFNRAERVPRWQREQPSRGPFPVVLTIDPPALAALVPDLLARSAGVRPFVYKEATIDEVRYQIVAHLLYGQEPPHALVAVAAFTVNLDWVRDEYFDPLLQQIERIGGNEDAFTFSVEDEGGTPVAGAGTAEAIGQYRRFPLLFSDAMVATPAEPSARIPEWRLAVSPRANAALLAGRHGAFRTLVIVGLAASVSLLALFMTVKAVQSEAVVASMKSDFVATVTHELKTPVACIRLIGDTLSQQRYESADTIHHYAGLLSQEASSLSRTIDQLLLYAKYSSGDGSLRAGRVSTHVRDLVGDAIDRFDPVFERLDVEVCLDIPEELPMVKVDRSAITQIVENIIDNAIKYSEDRRYLRIDASMQAGRVLLRFTDRGVGIAPEDLPHVCERFYRGRNVRSAGSGLGLAIARRVMQSHGGSIAIESVIGCGTVVALTLNRGRAWPSGS